MYYTIKASSVWVMKWKWDGELKITLQVAKQAYVPTQNCHKEPWCQQTIQECSYEGHYK
jgi:hypothetical protein